LLEYREFAFSDGAEFARRGAWRACFAERIGASFDGRVIFEIGCNDAAFLARVAAKHPTTAFIGIDWKYRALHTAAERVAASGLRNVALLHGRAQDVQKIFGDEEVDEIWVFHPDPCDKPQELRNRLIAEPFLADVHRVLRSGGGLMLKTDHAEYYRSAVHVVASLASRFELAMSSENFWNDGRARSRTEGRSFADEITSFEARFLKKRLPIFYLELTKRENAPRKRGG
jgi:tRNA (guanine-N7-)-methyltransferase